MGDRAAELHLRAKKPGAQRGEFPSIVGFEMQLASDPIENQRAPRLVGRFERKNKTPPEQFRAVHFQSESSESGVIQMALRFVHEQVWTTELIRLLEVKIFSHNPAAPAQTDAAEINLPSFGAQLRHETFFDKLRQTHLVQKEARNHDEQNDQQADGAGPAKKATGPPPRPTFSR